MRPPCLLPFLLPVFLPLPAPPLPAQSPMAPIIGTVLTPDGKPAVGAQVVVKRSDGRLFRCLDLQLRNEWVEVARARTDKVGRFGLQVPLGLALCVEVDLPPFARWSDPSVVPGEPRTVQLEAACTVRGRLVDAATGTGTPGALRAWNPRTQSELFAGRTDAEGRFRFDRLPSGPYCCDIDPDRVARPEWIESRLDAGEVEDNEWTCAPGVELTGRVTDAATAAPIAGARIGLGWTFDKAVRTDAAGRYTLRGFGGTTVIDVHVDAPGYERVRIDHNGLASGPVTQDVVLHRGVRVAGRIASASGAPVANAYVAAITATGVEVPWLAARSDADGNFVCDGFPRRCDGVLMVRCAGYASVVYSLPRPAGDGQIDFGTIPLQSPQLVHGIAEDGDGKPAAGIVVTLRGVNADMNWLAGTPSAWSFLRLYCGERQVRTDGSGAFAFGDVAPGEYALALGSMTDATPGLVDVTVEKGKDVPSVRLTR